MPNDVDYDGERGLVARQGCGGGSWRTPVFASFLPSFLPRFRRFFRVLFRTIRKIMPRHGSSTRSFAHPPTPMTKRLQAQAYTYRANCHTFSFSPGLVVCTEKLQARAYISRTTLYGISSQCTFGRQNYIANKMNSS